MQGPSPRPASYRSCLRRRRRYGQALEKLHAADTPGVVLDDLTKALDAPTGSLAVIRHGFKCFRKLIRVAYFAPAHAMNPDTQRLYQANRLTLTRQSRYSASMRTQLT